MIYKGIKNNYEVVIGLEIHAQSSSKEKLFSSSSNNFADTPNTNISIFDIGSPGSLPLLNKEAVQKAIAASLVLKGDIALMSNFDRKHYFYPDLPSGFQITQFYNPIMTNGSVLIRFADGSTKNIGIERMHIEQDAGKLIHDDASGKSLVDYNRAGIPLMEIVTTPCITSPEEAVLFLKKLQLLLRSANASTADMEKGSFRCDVNISLRPEGQKEFGTRAEIKNLNSFKFISKAIEYEIKRQAAILDKGEEVLQETRLFNVEKGQTSSMRSKEDASHYHYYPDGNIPCLQIAETDIEEVREQLPELPDKKYDRYTSELKIGSKEADFLVSDQELSSWFDELNKKHSTKVVISWLLNELVGRIKKMQIALGDSKLTLDNFSSLLGFIDRGDISGKSAKEVLTIILEEGKSAQEIIEEKGFIQVLDMDLINKVVDTIISNNPDEVTAYKGGKDRLMGFFVGLGMKELKGAADPAVISKVIKDKLS